MSLAEEGWHNWRTESGPGRAPPGREQAGEGWLGHMGGGT